MKNNCTTVQTVNCTNIYISSVQFFYSLTHCKARLITVKKNCTEKKWKKTACTVLQFVQFFGEGLKMSIYHEWFTANADEMTVKNPEKTVQTALYSFLAQNGAAKPAETEPSPEQPAMTTNDNIAPDVASLPPMRNRTGKPALPAEMWADGITTWGEARRIQGVLSARHATMSGMDKVTGRYYVRGYGWQWFN